MIWCKRYSRENNIVLAMADEDLMNKTFEEGELILTVGTFYKGELKTEDALLDLINEATIINAVGIKSTFLLVKQKLISKENIQKIGGISHVQVLVQQELKS